MLCQPVPELPEGKEWLLEIKWDGYRAIGTKDGPTCHLYSRNGKSSDRDFANVLPHLGLLKCRSAVVDGELVAMGEDGKPSFQALQKRSTRAAHLIVFDLLTLDGRDLRDEPLTARRRMLAKILPRGGEIVMSTELKGSGSDLLEQARRLGLEGIVAKRRNSRYESGERSGVWVKRRAEPVGLFLVGGYVPGSNGFDDLILAEPRGRDLHFVARLHAGFVPALRRTVWRVLKRLVQSACPFVDLPESSKRRWGQALDAEAMKKCRWLKPSVAVEVEYVERTDSGKLRHPRFVALSP